MWSSFIVPPVVMRAVALFVWSAPTPHPSFLAWTHPLPSVALNPMRGVRKQNKQAKAQQNSVLLGEEGALELQGRQRGPPNPRGVLGTPKSSGRHIRHKLQRSSKWNPCHKSQPLEMEELPNLEVSPMPRGNQVIEEARVSVFGGPLNSSGTGKVQGDPLISQGRDGGS